MLGTSGRNLVFLLVMYPLLLLAAPADEVKALLEAGKAAEAYALGTRNPDALGDPAFDFYFGVAAVDTRHAAEGVLALERYVVNFPANLNARLELARGYFIVGDDLRARAECARRIHGHGRQSHRRCDQHFPGWRPQSRQFVGSGLFLRWTAGLLSVPTSAFTIDFGRAA